MPIRLTWFEKQVFLQFNLGPGPILDLFAPLAFKAIYAGYKINLFETLNTYGKLDSGEISQKIICNENHLVILLDTLCSLGYLIKKKKYYSNSKMTKKWMLKNSIVNMGEMLGFFNDASERWSGLDKSICKGEPFENCKDWMDNHAGSWEHYHKNLRGVAGLLVDEIVSRSVLPRNANKLIDIGGSHGLYSVRFCQRYPNLTANIFDWEHARSVATQTIIQNNLTERIRFIKGDILIDEFGKDFDVALLFNVIRVFSVQDLLYILKKTHDAMNNGGTILIADQFCSYMKTPYTQANALLIVLELINSGTAKLYKVKEVNDLLINTGFIKPHEIKLRHSGGISIVSAICNK
jgi:hypothetical protein